MRWQTQPLKTQKPQKMSRNSFPRLVRVVTAAVLGLLLAGCVTNRKFVTADAFCQSLPKPEYEYRGKTTHDDPYVQDTMEATIAGCGFDRPKPRPPEWDAVTPSPRKQTRPVAKPSIWDRAKKKLS